MLLHHPHIHCVVPGGGLSPDRKRWIGCRNNFFLPVKILSRLFRGKFLALLDAAAKRGALRFAGSTAALADSRAWTSLLRQMYRKNWVVYAKPPFGSPEQVLKYLARYTHRVAISNRPVVSLTNEHVTFRYRDRAHGNTIREMNLDGVEFLRRFLLHVLPKAFVRIRHFGLLANRVRNTNLAACHSLLGATPATQRDPTETPDYDQPAICPICQTGRLRLIATLAPVVPFQPHREPLPPPDTS
jgi:Putative transposase